jgi:hypothetical protein
VAPASVVGFVAGVLSAAIADPPGPGPVNQAGSGELASEYANGTSGSVGTGGPAAVLVVAVCVPVEVVVVVTGEVTAESAEPHAVRSVPAAANTPKGTRFRIVVL